VRNSPVSRSGCSTKAPPICYVLAVEAGEEIDVHHGIVDVFAYQEALLIEAVFGIALLTMIWVGFRRWLQYKEKMSRLIAAETAERAAEYGALMERVEERLKAVEQIVTDSAQSTAQISTPPANPLPDPILKRGEVHPDP
jgi:hypothetical protein